MPVDTPAWARDAVFYQIFPDRFASSARVEKPGPVEPWDAPPTPAGFKGGDLLGIVERLDYLAELGVTALYLTPIFSSASNHRYHTYDYLSVDPLLGGDPAFRELVDTVHARGMRVVLDGVFNHSGRGFWPFHHVLETGAASPYRGWFHLDERALAAGRPLRAYPTSAEMGEASRLTSSGVGAGEASLRTLGYEAWWGLPALPKLNTDHEEMREYLLRVAEHWPRLGIDGWRLDVAEEIDGGYWEEFRRRVRAVDPEAYLVAEIWHPKPEWLTGRHFDALMNYPLAEAIIGFVAGRHLDRAVVREHHEYAQYIVPRDGASFLAELGRLLSLYDPTVTNVMLNLLGSHDAPRVRTVCGGDVGSVRLATVLQMTLPGAPCIYYGDEVGMEGHQDPDCRRSFPWDQSNWEASLHDLTRGAIALRRRYRALRDGEFRQLGAAGGAVAYLRSADGTSFLVAVNAGEAGHTLSLALPGDWVRAEVALSTAGTADAPATVSAAPTGGVALDIAPRSAVALRLDHEG
jgi:cyclomaltodextrinase